jgi:hypothetical protein
VPNTSGRFTLQYFHPVQVLSGLAPNNQDARPPVDQTDWPPSILTDFFYGCAVVQKWGSRRCRTILQELTKDEYYEQEASQKEQVPSKNQKVRERNERAERRALAEQRECRSEQQEQPMRLEDIMDLLLFFRTGHNVRSQAPPDPEVLPPRIRDEDLDASREKVEEWVRKQQSNGY